MSFKNSFACGDPPERRARIMNMLTSARLGQEKRASNPDVSYGVVAKLTTRADTFAQKDADVNVQERVSAAPWVAEIEAIRLHQDQAAFAALFQHFAPRVKAFLMKSGANAALAEETTQEVMATLWTKAHMFDPARASAATWIFTIARNRSIDALRKQRRPEPEDLPWGPEAEPDQEDALALQQESSQLARALSELPEKQRVLIERAYFGDLSHSEIAAETGLPLGTIKSRIRLALDRLRHAMK